MRLQGLEPTRIAAREPKSRMSTNSITGAYSIGNDRIERKSKRNILHSLHDMIHKEQ